MAPCRPWGGPSIDVVVTAESENNEYYEWRDKLPVDEQLKKLAEAWARVHGVPGTAVGFDDANGCEVDLLQTPQQLGWGIRGEVFLKAFPTEDRFMEQGGSQLFMHPEEKPVAEAREESAPTTAASTTAPSLAPATPFVNESAQAPEDAWTPEPTEAKEAKASKEAKEPEEFEEAGEPQELQKPQEEAQQPKSRARRGSRGQAAAATSPSNAAATPPSKAASSASRTPQESSGRASSGRASTGRAITGKASAKAASAKATPAPSSLPAASESTPTDAEEITFEQANPKKQGSSAYTRYEKYKRARTVDEALTLGAARGDIAHDFKRGFLKRCRAA